MKISKQEIRDTDISDRKQYVSEYEQCQVDMLAGQQGYKLYAYLSQKFDGIKIVELGTRYGTSAIMFAINPNNHVDTYDVTVCAAEPDISNLTFHIRNMFLNKYIEKLLDYDIIFLDVGDHSGILEEKLYQLLVDKDWKGILICDDIGPSWPAMNKFWNELDDKYPKYDMTDVGHAAGTGIIDFSRKLEILC